MINNRLKEILAKKNIKQKDLVMETGVTKATISNIVNNKFEPSIGLVFKISQYLDTPIEEIFYEEDDFIKMINAPSIERTVYRINGVILVNEKFEEQYIVDKLKASNIISFASIKLEKLD